MQPERDFPFAEGRGLWAPWKAVDHKAELPFNKACKLENYVAQTIRQEHPCT